MEIKNFLGYFHHVQGHAPQWTARCPAHDDRHNSLSVSVSDDGKILLRCHAGCCPEDIVSAVGLTMRDLFNEPAPPPVNFLMPRPVEYLYNDGKLKKVRKSTADGGKTFYWLRRDDKSGQWEMGRDHISPELYIRYDKDVTDFETADTIFLVEGEKDVETMARLGYCAATGADGAGPGKWRDTYTEKLKGRRVSIIPDNDDAGQAYAKEIARNLFPVCPSVCILDLKKVWPEMPEHADITDMAHRFAANEVYEKLAWLEQETPPLSALPALPPDTVESSAASISSTDIPVRQDGYTLEQYARDSKLPADFLRDICGLAACPGKKNEPGYLKIPYWNIHGELQTFRKHCGEKTLQWRRGSKGKVCLYGEWRIPEFAQNGGWAVLTLGETNTQSLWYLGIPAVGIAEISAFRPEQAALLQGLNLYIHYTPDNEGIIFQQKIFKALLDNHWSGELYRWQCTALAEKDPSAVCMAHGKEQGEKLIRQLLEQAEPVQDIRDELMPEVIPGAPIRLRQAEGFLFSDKGISAINAQTMTPALICKTPILLTRRLKNIETRVEKIEVAFWRDGEWFRAIYPREIVFSNRGILALAQYGCTVNTENAKAVVRFLAALEMENIDEIPKTDSISAFGWQTNKRFFPGRADNLELDIDTPLKYLAAAYCQRGSLEEWVQAMAPHRNRNRFRFILAASFAAPLLRIIRQRTFIVYNWGNSRSGKTAAVKAALSAWGDPERLMVSFNATQVGLERVAALHRDLPLGVDERQLAGKQQSDVERKIYMLAAEQGRIRGDKTGGLQPTQQWRTVALCTGEEPASAETSMTGVSTRSLEIFGSPFDNETQASLMHQQSAQNYGFAGPAFINRIVQIPEQTIVEAYEQMRQYVSEVSIEKNGSHIAAVSAVALADVMISQWLFGADRKSAWESAKKMAASILVDQIEANSTDVNENAVQFVVDWVLSNQAYFTADSPGTRCGFFSGDGNTVYIYPSVLKQALDKAGYASYRKIIRYMAENELIGSEVDKLSGKKVYTVRKWFNDRTTRFVEFYIGKLAKSEHPGNIERMQSDALSDWMQEELQEITDDRDLPF